MHLVSYLEYFLGVHGKQCSYVIINKDTDYDNIIRFWKEKGYNISWKQKISGSATMEKKITSQAATVAQIVNSKISAGMAYDFSGDERSELNLFMQEMMPIKFANV